MLGTSAAFGVLKQVDANGAPHPDASTYASKFTGKYEHRVVKGGIGHNCRKRLRRPSPKPSSTPAGTDRSR
jgi:hypothetical protein